MYLHFHCKDVPVKDVSLRCDSPLISYDNDGTTRDEIKERFCLTMDFVENYLREVVSQNIPFSDKEKNKLTFEVPPVHRCYEQMRCQLDFLKL